MFTVLAATLFPAFCFLDYLTEHASYKELWAIRFATTFVFAGSYFLIKGGRLLRNPFRTTLVLLVVASASISSMCAVLTGYKSSYYAGVNLVMLAAVLLFPWGPRRTGISATAVVATYVVIVLFDAGFAVDEPSFLINNLYFLLATGIIGTSAAALTDRLRRESFLSHLETKEARAQLERQDAIKSQFFANVSHELRTPLTLILGPLRRILKSNALNTDDKRALLVAERNAHVLVKQVNDLLEVARLDAGRAEINYARIDLAALAKRICSLFEALALEKNIAFAAQAPDTLSVEADPEKLERVLINLLSNAFKFTPPGGKISCLVFESADTRSNARIVVADSGPGIAPELRARVFERFYQIEDSNTRHHGGTGLGLAIVKEFVHLHDGRIALDESPYGGARFTIDLPMRSSQSVALKEWRMRDSSALEHEIRHLSANGTTGESSPASGQQHLPLVLVVEDNYDMSEFIREVLSKQFRVEAAFDGAEGSKRAKALKPDVIISDIMMPGSSGIDLVKEVRADAQLSSTPVLMLTAKADDELRVELLRNGIQDYLLKPFSSEELLARVSNWAQIKRSADILKTDLANKQGNLEELSREAIQRNEQLRNALEARDEFISVASHELKTPLTALKLQTQYAQKLLSAPSAGPLDAKASAKLLRNYNHQLNRLAKLVDDMLDISRIKTGRLQLVRCQLDLVELIRDTIELLGLTGSKITFACPEKAIGTWDRLRLEQVIINLLSNAVKYGAQKPVDVTLTCDDKAVTLTVKDQGIGIPKEAQARIFDRFERASSARHFGGLGLGLYITKQIIDAHGGSIEVFSELNQGSEFTVKIPLGAPHDSSQLTRSS